MKNEYVPRHKDMFVVTVTELCPCCKKMKPDVKKRKRIKYWKYVAAERDLVSCNDCHTEDGNDMSEYEGC